ncbi:MAG: protein O-GlcNAcase [Firmicutes bacterium]|jgi:hyaluronoglucosaminidase|nr:protein O-GlcNAcase [Bacillota bacterium]MDH7495903.1 protein O-GlcNAcase [Bacillota bacterium]
MSEAFAWRGVVEGFYGKPWTHDERKDMLSFMPEIGMNAYIYAPKDDPYHRHRWRAPYPGDILVRLSELASHARKRGITFIFAVSPGLSLRYSEKRDLDALVEKLKAMHDAGVRAFALFFDDIPAELRHDEDRKAFGDLAAAQVSFTNAVYARLKELSAEASLMVCPTQYCGDPATEYVREIGEGLDPAIDVMWTGPVVCSKELTLEHTKAVAESLKRPVTYWDNYPVNDGPMKSELHIGPYTGRSPYLPEAAKGVFLNPMNQAEASKIPLAAAARYLDDPVRYDPQSAWEDAVARVLGRDALGACALFADACAMSPLHQDDPPGIASVLERARKRAQSGELGEAAGILSSYMLEMKAAAAMLTGNPNRKFVEEVKPWLDEFSSWAEVGLDASKLIEMARAYIGTAGGSSRVARFLRALPIIRTRSRLVRRLSRSLRFKTRTCGNIVLDFAVDVLRRVS